MIAALLALIVLIAACGGEGEEETFAGTEGRAGADRYLRLFEVSDFGSSLFVYDRALPPTLAALLNPGLTDETPSDDIVSLVVHPDGVLLGSYHVRRRDGTNEVWVMFDVPGADPDVLAVIQEQMDQTPWQVTGGQSNELISVVSFRSTTSGDIDGFVTVQALPSTPTFSVTVERDGEVLVLELVRGASTPELDLRYRELTGGLEVTAVLSDFDFEVGDVIVSVGEQSVSDKQELFEALAALAGLGEPLSAVAYRLTIQSPSPVADPVFVLPVARPAPEGFPATFLLTEDLTLVDVNWGKDPVEGYQLTLVTSRSAFEIAEQYRTLLDEAGWVVTDDEAQGFGTILSFENSDIGFMGIANIDQFPSDESLNAISLQIQSTN
jgi:hypothetical protein